MDRLLVDAMCGKLATYLRMCGYDAAYVLDGTEPEAGPTDEEILARADASGRRIVTRDRAFADRAADAVLIESRDVTDQLRELFAADYELRLPDEPSRCGACNGPLEPVEPDRSTPAAAPNPDEVPVWRCRDCGQYFWRGSHWDDVAATLAAVRADSRTPK